MSGLRVCGALLLAARAAASRFAPRRGKARGPRDAWPPIALRWRHKRRRLDSVRARCAVTAARAVWLSQFHLHFSACVRERARGGALPRFLAATATHHERRTVLNHHWTSLRAATLAVHIRPAYRSPHAQAGKVLAPKAHVSAPAAARSFRPRIDRRERARSVALPGFPAATATRHERRTVLNHHWMSLRATTLAVHTRPAYRSPRAQAGKVSALKAYASAPAAAHSYLPSIRPRELAASRRFPLAPGHAVPRHRHESAAPRVPLGLPNELVWRAVPRPPREIAVDGPRPDLAAPSHRAPARSFPGQEAAPETPARAARAAALQITNLDPALLDRLADDVIRRVERRVRIERERRGL